MKRSTLSLPTPRAFDLRRAACSYGYIVLAPNHWDVPTQSFQRPLRLPGDRIVRVTVTQPAPDRLRVHCSEKLSRDDAAEVKRQLARVFRLDESFDAWWKLNPAARRARFARLIRSPDLFEDIVKTITGCNVSWPNTRRMNALLCEQIGGGAFPSPRQVAALTPTVLAERCKVGYRAERIVRVARDLCSGALDAAWFEDRARTGDELHAALLRIHGIGPYAAANVCQLLGHYDRIAIDTETYRHFCDTQGLTRPDDPKRLHDDIEAHYAKDAPYQFLGYWFDLWRFYEKFIGRPAWKWKPDEGGSFTAAAFRKAEQEQEQAPRPAPATTRPTRAARAPRSARPACTAS